MKNLIVKNISYSYYDQKEEIPALINISFKLEEGDIVAVVGESGSGKTTLLRVIAGLFDQKEGQIILNDFDISDIQVKDRDIAFVFQTPVLYPHMTIYENLYTALGYYGLTREDKDERIKKILKEFKMTKFVNCKPKYMSLGEQQRVCLMRALIREPSLILLDEPFANLDPINISRCSTLLLNYVKEYKIPTLYVTHDIKEAFRVSNKILHLKKGKIAQFDSTKKIFNNKKNELTKLFNELNISFKDDSITNLD